MRTSRAKLAGKKMQRIDWRTMRKEITAWYRSGLSTRAIGELLQPRVSHTTVCKHLDAWRVKRRSGDVRRGILIKDLAGQRRGRLTIIGRDGDRYPPRWMARCDCGAFRSYLLSELWNAKSCGCGPKGRKKRRCEKS
jgi:hypothetical protein